MATMFYEKDCNKEMLSGKTVAVIATAARGMRTQNLKESGVNVIVGLYEGSKSAEKAKADGLTVMTRPRPLKTLISL